MPNLLVRWRGTVELFEAWLLDQGQYAAGQWKARLDSTNDARREGALAEAAAWRYLQESAGLGKPGLARRADGSGPDFSFEASDQRILVEVTNIACAVAQRRTGLIDGERGMGEFAPLTSVIKREVLAKAGQFANASLDAPLVVFVTTFHSKASVLCLQRGFVEHLLYSQPQLAATFDPATGEVIDDPAEETDMELSLFMSKKGSATARRHISAVLVGGFGHIPPPILGALHPDASRPLDPRVILGAPFCRFSHWPLGSMVSIEWTLPDDDT